MIDNHELCMAVTAIKKIQATYRLHKINWQGDPCSPVLYKWDGLNCSSANLSTSLRIISLYVGSVERRKPSPVILQCAC